MASGADPVRSDLAHLLRRAGFGARPDELDAAAGEADLAVARPFRHRLPEGPLRHGTAAPLFVAGPGVKGGRFYGEEPSLTKLDDGNLEFTTDFRSALSTMLAEVLGVDPKVAISGSFPPLNLV